LRLWRKCTFGLKERIVHTLSIRRQSLVQCRPHVDGLPRAGKANPPTPGDAKAKPPTPGEAKPPTLGELGERNRLRKAGVLHIRHSISLAHLTRCAGFAFPTRASTLILDSRREVGGASRILSDRPGDRGIGLGGCARGCVLCRGRLDMVEHVEHRLPCSHMVVERWNVFASSIQFMGVLSIVHIFTRHSRVAGGPHGRPWRRLLSADQTKLVPEEPERHQNSRR
jgi:hypothetical protein